MIKCETCGAFNQGGDFFCSTGQISPARLASRVCLYRKAGAPCLNSDTPIDPNQGWQEPPPLPTHPEVPGFDSLG